MQKEVGRYLARCWRNISFGLQSMKVDQSIISKIENGTRPVYDYELPKIAKALKVTVGWLLKEK